MRKHPFSLGMRERERGGGDGRSRNSPTLTDTPTQKRQFGLIACPVAGPLLDVRSVYGLPYLRPPKKAVDYITVPIFDRFAAKSGRIRRGRSDAQLGPGRWRCT